MKPNVMELLARQVDAAVKQRAGSYLSAVRFTTRDPHLIRATVAGTELYDVTLSANASCLDVSCTCPHFASGAVCKHIWAVLLRLSSDRYDFAAEATHFDVGPEPDGGAQHAGRVRVRSTPPRPVPAAPASAWREALRPIREAISLQTYFGRTSPHLDTPVLYAIVPAKSGTTLAIELMTRPLKKNGVPGAARAITINPGSVASMEEPDREILGLLLNGQSEATTSGREPIRLGWPAAAYLLPKLAATGRLLLEARSSTATPLQWSEGDPWQLGIDVQTAGEAYVASGFLMRAGEVIPLEEVRLLSVRFAFTDTLICMLADDDVFRWASVVQKKRLVIPRAEAGDFRAFAASAGASVQWNLPPELAWTEVEAEPQPVLLIAPRQPYTETHAVELMFDYAGTRLPWPERIMPLEGDVRHPRKRDLEKAHYAEAERHGVRRDWNRLDLPAAKVGSAIRALVARGWHVEYLGKRMRPEGDFRVQVKSGIDWLEVDAEVTFGDVSVSLGELLAAVEAKQTTVDLPDGSAGFIDSNWIEQIAPFVATGTRTKDAKLRFKESQLALVDVLLTTLPAVEIDEQVEQARERLRSIRVEALDAPPGFRGTLRQYQREALGWMAALRDLGFGGCLADDMGLGKTVQVLAMLEARRVAIADDHRPSLIVVPRSLIFNWKSEAERFAPELRVLDLSGSERHDLLEEAHRHDVLLTTYALLRRDILTFAAIPLDYAILDEAQAVKNSTAETSKAVRLLDARHRLALTGTPVENSIGDLASIFAFINPGMLGGTESRMASLVREAAARTEEGHAARELIGKVVRPFVLRRTKSQVAPELPPRIEKTLFCELSEKERRGYDELRQHYRSLLTETVAADGMAKSKMHILEALLRLRQAACHPRLLKPRSTNVTSTKFEVLLEELQDLVTEGHKALVFSQFTSLLGLLRKELDRVGYRYEYLDGQTRDRQSAVERFQTDPSIPLFLISLKAGGTGLNLTAAEYVFVLDPWWNPAVEAQAIDRTHRIGQTETVFAYRLVARDTIEEKILELQATKRELADAIITEDNSLLRQLTEDDLAMLLS